MFCSGVNPSDVQQQQTLSQGSLQCSPKSGDTSFDTNTLCEGTASRELTTNASSTTDVMEQQVKKILHAFVILDLSLVCEQADILINLIAHTSGGTTPHAYFTSSTGETSAVSIVNENESNTSIATTSTTPLKQTRLDFSDEDYVLPVTPAESKELSILSSDDPVCVSPPCGNINQICPRTGRVYCIFARKANGIRVGAGDVVTVLTKEGDDTSALSYCQVASVWQEDSDTNAEITVAGRWLEPMHKLTPFMSKTRNR